MHHLRFVKKYNISTNIKKKHQKLNKSFITKLLRVFSDYGVSELVNLSPESWIHSFSGYTTHCLSINFLDLQDFFLWMQKLLFSTRWADETLLRLRITSFLIISKSLKNWSHKPWRKGVWVMGNVSGPTVWGGPQHFKLPSSSSVMTDTLKIMQGSSSKQRCSCSLWEMPYMLHTLLTLPNAI